MTLPFFRTDRVQLAWTGLQSGVSRALDIILPPTCPLSGERVDAPGLLSASAWAAIRFIDDPVCARCGAPFAVDYGEGAECPACVADPPAFGRARAAFVYDDASYRLVVSFKHSDRTELAPLFAPLIVRAAAPLMQSDTVFVATPLHRRRLIARRFNQAALLAGGAARISGRPVLYDALVRVRATAPQKQLSAAARKTNVAGAFAAPAERRASFAGRHVILVDDVLTTGATLSACARTLKRAGARSVDAVVLARVAPE